ncbi:MAG: hypothetical protein Q3Y00_02465 [Bacteroides sp.]|nr:hypothetical protein [Bacteroides sp.]MDR3880808.1 hypothetical protein [Bacteroides sp.]
MENELEELYKELNEVKACDLEYLPKYGYSSKRRNHSAYRGRY